MASSGSYTSGVEKETNSVESLFAELGDLSRRPEPGRGDVGWEGHGWKIATLLKAHAPREGEFTGPEGSGRAGKAPRVGPK